VRVGFDLDGVGYVFQDSVIRYMDHAGLTEHYNVFQPTSTWSFFKEWGMSLEDFLQICNDGADAGFIFSGGYMDHFPDVVRRAKELGHSVHIVTDRRFGATPEVSQTLTRQWLAQHEIPYDTLTFSADKTVVKTDVFVEDKLENYDALEAAGTFVYLVNRPWNQEPGRRRRRIKSVDEYGELIENWTFLSRSI
jgi:hypothetical protein